MTDYIQAFKNKARAWASDVVALYNTPVKGELAEEKARLLKWAGYIKKGVESIMGTIEELEKVGLGIVPLIPVAVIGGSLALIFKWSADYATFKAKVAEQIRLEKRGVSPAVASQIVKAKSGTPFVNFDTKSVAVIAGVAGGLYYLTKGASKSGD